MIDIEEFTLNLRKIAGYHQSGRAFDDVKSEVDKEIHTMMSQLGHDRSFQACIWAKIWCSIEQHISVKSDPSWVRVMRYAKFRVKTRLNTARYNRSRKG